MKSAIDPNPRHDVAPDTRPDRPRTVSARLGFAQPEDAPRIPERILSRIRERQDSSEVLIGWVQLGVLLVFSVLYFVSPSSRNAEVAFQPVPWVLGLYLAFTVVRVLLAARHRLPGWMLVASVIVDMSLLMVLIWSFHLQYQQPPSFYLKAPTLLYVFVFIALRALRFEARYVIIAGITAATGWALMVGYAVWLDVMTDPTRSMVTRDYVKYMTSNSILIGAEFDKIISIIVVTIILALAISRARTTMVQAAVEQTAAEDLSRFVPTEVADRILHSEEQVMAGETERGEATILFVDIEGFTAIGESLEPEQLIRTLNHYFEIVCEPILRLDGVVTQFQGDAILASFNMPRHNPAHAANAVKAALTIQQRLADMTFANELKLKARVGVNSGMVVGGLVGTQDRVGYTVHGDAVNLAARLESLNKETGTRILFSTRTAELAATELSSLGVESHGTMDIRGHMEPIEIFSIASSTASESLVRSLESNWLQTSGAANR